MKINNKLKISTKKNKYNGITLIALVITIVILLILTSIVITTISRRKWFDKKSARSKIQSKNVSNFRRAKLIYNGTKHEQ